MIGFAPRDQGATSMLRNATLHLWTAVFSLAASSSPAAPPDAGPPPTAPQTAPAAWAPLPTGIDEASLRRDLSRLAADEMGGRRVGTAGIGLAADFIESRFRS